MHSAKDLLSSGLRYEFLEPWELLPPWAPISTGGTNNPGEIHYMVYYYI